MQEIERLKQELKKLNQEYKKISSLKPKERSEFGRNLNARKTKILQKIEEEGCKLIDNNVEELDITAPCAPNTEMPKLLTADCGSRHPLMTELDRVIKIYQSMGFYIVESRQLDDEFHMFDSLNFAKEHPARDGYDTFRTEENLIPPAHTSTMEHRALKKYKFKLEKGEPIAVVIPGRVYRNEDVDATHEHTFYQCEGVYVSENCNMGNMLGILREFFEKYYGQKLNIRTQPGYFPFTEPSLEFMIEKPNMTHPNVLKMAGIDPTVYHGFAWGGGMDRLVMLKYGLDDVRYFESGNLNFLKEF